MPMLAGVGLLVVCSSSSAAAMMMGGGEGDDDSSGAGAGAGAGAGTPAAKTTTTFVGSEIPNDALVIEPSEISPMNKLFNSPKDSTDAESTYYFSLQTDGNLVWVKRGTGTQWSMGSHTTMPNTKLYLQGDGNLCAYGTTNKCAMTHDSAVPAGQHKLVGTKEGLLYVDHGTGVAGRSVIFTPPTATETYVLPY